MEIVPSHRRRRTLHLELAQTGAFGTEKRFLQKARFEMKVDVSVVLPVRNAEEYVAAAVESMIAQDFSNWELILINDGSTDDSPQICQDLAEREPRIVLISRPNRGLVSSINEGIGRSAGKYIARMDADDVSHHSRLAAQFARMESDPDLALLGTMAMLMDQAGRPLGPTVWPTTHQLIDRMNLRGENKIIHSSVMIRRDKLEKVGLYRPEFFLAEDLDLWLRLAEVGRIANLKGAFINYRIHPTSLSNARRGEQMECVRRVIQTATERRGISIHERKLNAKPKNWNNQLEFYFYRALAFGFVETARAYGSMISPIGRSRVFVLSQFILKILPDFLFRSFGRAVYFSLVLMRLFRELPFAIDPSIRAISHNKIEGHNRSNR